MVVLKRIGVLSFARVEAFIFAVLGLIESLFVSYLTIRGGVGLATLEQSPQLALGYWSLIALPLFYALIGFIMGALGAWLYNHFARLVGGIEVEFSEDTRSAWVGDAKRISKNKRQ